MSLNVSKVKKDTMHLLHEYTKYGQFKMKQALGGYIVQIPCSS